MLEHVPYEVKAAADSVDDDVLGVSYKVKKVEGKTAEQGAPKEQPKAEEPEPEDEFGDIPF
ncbi:hypothetical protein D3C87_2147960 [compost metagenome]